MGGDPPAGLLDQSITTSFMRAFGRAYPDGLSPAEMERPDEQLLMRNLKELVDEKWKEFFGIVLSSFTLRSFRADPAALALIRQFQSVPKTPQQMAQEMMAKMQAARGENKLELMPRKNGILTLNGSSASVDWALRGNRDFTITLEGIDSHGTLVNGVIVITYMDLGVKLTFEKVDR